MRKQLRPEKAARRGLRQTCLPAARLQDGQGHAGFSLIELMIVLVIFLIVSGMIVVLLNDTQVRYRAEQDFLDSVQTARLGVEQVVRDVHNAGTPRPFTYTATADKPLECPAGWAAAACADLQRRYAIPFLGAPDQTCAVGPLGTCTVPDGFNLTLELDLDPFNAGCPEQVEIVEYSLVADPAPAGTSTLMRRARSKPGNPVFSASCFPLNPPFAPFVENVLNTAAEPVFTYDCAGCTPEKILEVRISLRVRSSRRDLRTQQFREITINGLAERMNSYP